MNQALLILVTQTTERIKMDEPDTNLEEIFTYFPAFL
jgi:hypothetical protein